MIRLLALLCLLATATSASAEDAYALVPDGIKPIGHGGYLYRYPTVTLEAGERGAVWLSLANCPGGRVVNVFAYKVNPTTPAEEWIDYMIRISWGYPHAYGGYLAATSVKLWNRMAEPLTFDFKLSVRCEE